MQIHADVSNIPITATAVPEAVTLGSAVLASVAGGLHPDVATAAHAMVSVERVIEPDREAHEAYQFYFDAYLASYDAMRDLMHKVVDHVSRSDLIRPSRHAPRIQGGAKTSRHGGARSE